MIYYLQHIETGLIKIGTSNYFDARLKNLVRMYGEMKVLCLIDGTQRDEALLHKQFRHANIKGQLVGNEWFTPTPDLLDYIGKLGGSASTVATLKTVSGGGARVVNNIPNILTRHKKMNRLTNAELATELKVSEAYISRVLKAKRGDRVDLDIVYSICAKLNLTPNDLLWEEEDKQ